MHPSEAYEAKASGYFGHDRRDLLARVPADPPGRVLEIGAGDGSTLVALKQSGKAREVVGVELMSIPGNQQLREEIDRFIIADVELHCLDLGPESFDVILCGDVLEHLRDPWATLKYLATLLRSGGTFIVSLPNIRYWKAFGRILLGDFRYAESGVLDRSHLRFFCKKNMLHLVEGSHLVITHTEPSFLRQPQLRRDRLMNAITCGLMEQFFAQQYIITARKP